MTTPLSASIIAALGSDLQRGGVALTRDEHRALCRVYRYAPEKSRFLQAGADLQLMRRAETDGLRLVAWLARFVDTGEDPLKTLIRAVVAAGLEVPPEDCRWTEQDE